MNTINRGSEWRKWDLHLHSPYTIIHGSGSYNGVSDEKFIEKIKEEGISVIGLTNYFKFVEQDYILADKLRNAGITTFMNLEFRLTNINDSNMLSDYHIIFSDKLKKSEIETFISNLDVTIGSSKKKLNTLSDEEIKNNAAINFEDITKLLQNESLNLKGKYLTAFLSRGHGNSVCGKNRSYTVYEEITRRSDLVMNSSDFKETLDSDKIYWLGKSAHVNNYVKPLLQSSDAHCLDDIGVKLRQIDSKKEENKEKQGVFERDGKYFIEVAGFTWIKADTTFEGLKQIIYEPEERIRYGKIHPVTNQNYMLIDYVEYNYGEKTYFNSGLNVIIGGRSTGKSTLLNSIAKYQGNKNFILNNHYTFEDDQFKVVWLDGKSDKDRFIEFIPQEFMINISKNKEMFNDLLSEIITKRGMNLAEQSYKEKVEKIITDITREVNDYFLLKRMKDNLIKPEGDKKAAENLIRELTEKIGKIRIENQFSEDDNKNYQVEIKKLNNLLLEIKLLEKDFENLNSLKTIDFSLNVDLGELSDKTKSLVIEKLDFINKYSISLWNEFIDETISKIKNNILLKNNEKESIESSNIFIKGKELEIKNEELGQLQKQLDENRRVIENIEEYFKNCAQIEEKLKIKLNSILDNFCKFHKDICIFSNEFNIEEKDLKITVRVSPIMFEDKVDYLNSRNSINNSFIEEFNEKIKNFDESKYKEFVDKLISEQNLTFNKNKNMDDLFKDIFMTNWYSYDYIVTYQNDEFKDMSQGKKSFVILKLLLEFSNDKKPVLIDQPEDSLDNRAIFHELRKYLIDTKKNRQIILVTHNPNVVIGADAENVIIANQHSNLEKNRNGKKFQYINGSIENTSTRDETCEYVLESQGIREHIFDVLEGGKEAFEKREKKYNY